MKFEMPTFASLSSSLSSEDEDSLSAGILDLSLMYQQCVGPAPQHRVNPVGCEIDQGHQDKGALVHARMRQHGIRRGTNQITHGDDVEIQCPGGIRDCTHASELLLNRLQPGEQPRRIRGSG